MKNDGRLNRVSGSLSILFILLLITGCAEKQEKAEPANWAERLGYPAGTKVIMLHADDAGMCEEANIATARYLDNNQIQSTAVMMPCPNADEFIRWAIDHPDKDVGLHLTHTAEWKDHRWGPVADPTEVPGLVDPDGMLWPEVPDVVQHASAEEVEKEVRAQIDRSIAMGYKPDHIDTHMGTLYGHASYVEVFIKIAEEYGIPANAIDLSDSIVADLFKKQGYPIDENVIELVENYTLPKLDFFTSVPNGATYEEKIENFKNLVRSLPPGLTEIIFHPSVETENLKTITNSWQQRVWEAEMFSDPGLISFFEEEAIVFTNWKEIMKKYNAE
jgi:chitin disaccharide deacetylase